MTQTPAIAVLLAALGGPSAVSAADAVAGLDRCDAGAVSAPARVESYRCHLEHARRERAWDAAAEHLQGLLLRPETAAGATLYLAEVRADHSAEGVIPLLRHAVERFAGRGDVRGEIHARIALASRLVERQLVAPAGEAVRRAAALAEAMAEPLLIARARLAQASLALAHGDYSSAATLASDVEATVFPDGPRDLQLQLEHVMGVSRWAQDQMDEAQDHFRAAARIARQAGDAFSEARYRYSLAFLQANLLLRDGHAPADTVAPIREALALAIDARNPRAELRCRLVLGQAGGETALAHFDRAYELAMQVGDFDRALEAKRFRAHTLLDHYPERTGEALAELAQAVSLARSRGDLEQETSGRIGLAGYTWLAGDRQGALSIAETALDGLERLRALQWLGETRARWLSRFSFFYHRTASWYLQVARSTDPVSIDALQQAVDVMERFRGRVLFDVLDAAGAAEGLLGDSAHSVLLREVSRTHRRLQEPELADRTRLQVLETLDEVETRERAYRRALRDTTDTLDGAAVPRANLREVQRLLADDEAVLYFQLSARADVYRHVLGNESWLLTLTREHRAIHELPDQGEIESAITIFLALLQRGDGSEADASVLLYQSLLARALESLPPGVEHLILVLDGELQTLPLEALRPAAGRPPLSARYRFERAPSMALLLRSRQQADLAAPRPVLALANPRIDPDAAGAPASVRDGARHLGALDYAEKEGRRLVRRLGRGSRLLVGAKAAEGVLKSPAVADFAILHLAAHALVDDAQPSRSAVLLAPGDGGEDGVLELHEVPALALDGKLVVLAACRSAAGDVVAGEGAMGLAWGFLRAGASSVVASLWPLRDDLGAALFDRFYREIDRGAPVSAALQTAQRELDERGVAARHWAGVVVLGAGHLAPVDPSARRTGSGR